MSGFFLCQNVGDESLEHKISYSNCGKIPWIFTECYNNFMEMK
jgi:hypothetical protein